MQSRIVHERISCARRIASSRSLLGTALACSLLVIYAPGCVVSVPTDSDGDGHVDFRDNCPDTANSDQLDADGDGIGDACDNCRLANTDQADANGNGLGDACEAIGTWQHVSGSLFESLYLSSLRYMTIGANGQARLHFRKSDPALLYCEQATVSFQDSDTIELSLSRSASPLTLTFSRPDIATLILIDGEGQISSFSRVDQIPAEFECGQLNTLRRWQPLATSASRFSGLGYDGTKLWYEGSATQQLYPFDPATGDVGEPKQFGTSPYTHVQAMQGADAWVHCGCGNSEFARRITASGAILEQVATTTELGAPTAIEALAVDPTGGVIWLFGRELTRLSPHMLRANFTAEPDELLLDIPFPAIITAMAFDGSRLWAIAGSPVDGQRLIRLDAVTLNVVETYMGLDPDIHWHGLAATGDGRFYLLGVNENSESRIVETNLQ